jgi:hypothetical protein
MKQKFILIGIPSNIIFISCKKNNPHFCDGDDTIIGNIKSIFTGPYNHADLNVVRWNLYVAEGGLVNKFNCWAMYR